MHFDDGLADESGAKEGPEGDEEVSARDASQVKQRVRDLNTQYSNAKHTQAYHSLGNTVVQCYKYHGFLLNILSLTIFW